MTSARKQNSAKETEQRIIGEDEKQRFQEREFGEVAEQRSAA
jgi:hypothetical protein